MMLRLLRQFAAVICKELDDRYSAEVEAQPGRLLFPKRVHDLGSLEPATPDGLSLAYIRLAAAKNEVAWNDTKVEGAVPTLAFHVSQQIGRAALLERRLVEKLR
jgi:hypothetical protein